MTTDMQPIRFEGETSSNPLAYRHYDATRRVGDRTLAEHLRLAVCYWHSFVYAGLDPFGAPTINHPWNTGDALRDAEMKANAAFRLFETLGVPFFTFHDRDVVAEGDTLAESLRRLHLAADMLAARMERSGTRLLWGTANLFSHPRYMAGAATNPDPDVFAYAAATVKNCMDVTHRLGGENYVLWGGREGYDTLLNTDLAHELDQLGRFLNLVVEYKHRIGFSGAILIEPKPKEPTKHQYDYDAATVSAFLHRYGLEGEVKLNLEQNHAILAGHSFEHEIATAAAHGILGSLDINRGDELLGWDTDQFPNNVPSLALAFVEVIKAGGLGSGGLNFDARIRRQSIAPDDIIAAHVGAIDVCARAFLAAHRLVEEAALSREVAMRYAGWRTDDAHKMLAGELDLAAIEQMTLARGIEPQPRSGRQEILENLINRYV